MTTTEHLDLAGLRELLAGATPAPWRVVMDERNSGYANGRLDKPYSIPRLLLSGPLGMPIVSRSGFARPSRPDGKANAALIVAAASSLRAGVEHDGLREECANLTKALTGLTCSGSEFFIRKGERYTADIPACLEYIRRARESQHTAMMRFKREGDDWKARGEAAEAKAEEWRQAQITTSLELATCRDQLSILKGRVEWRDIKDAPRDGTEFLALDATGAMYRLGWERESADEGYWIAHCGQPVVEPPSPTHWQPLPAPPLLEGK